MVLVLDGGFGTELEATGEDLNHSLWSARILGDPKKEQLFKQVHLQYLEAGADIFCTGSYQASVPGFVQFAGCSVEEGEARLQRTVQLAREAVDEFLSSHPEKARSSIQIAVSVGSYGGFLADGSEFTGDYKGVSDDEVLNFHREKIGKLLEQNPDLVALETIPNLAEAQVLVKLLASEFPTARAWMTASCKDESHISSGEDFAEFVRIASQCDQVFAVGINCTDPKNVTALLKIAKPLASSKQLICYPNGGYKWIAITKTWDNSSGYTDDQWAVFINEWIDAGASIVGGCCRTNSKHIALIKKIVQERLSTI